MTPPRFSDRHGFGTTPPEISVRHDAPSDLRGLVMVCAYGAGLHPSDVRALVCRLLLEVPDRSNWSEYPNIDSEVEGLLGGCQWFEVYDIIEEIYRVLKKGGPRSAGGEVVREPHANFETAMNKVFVKKGVGWKLVEGILHVRGPEAFEVVVGPVAETLSSAGLTTASAEIHEALRDLGRRPHPDITGAVTHAMAAAECVARAATNDPRPTLGAILDRSDDLLPKPLDQGLAKMWCYASEFARHVREGRTAQYEEAELTVMICAAVVTYLERKMRGFKNAGASGA